MPETSFDSKGPRERPGQQRWKRGPHSLPRLLRARLPRNASARRRYDVCRAQTYRARQASDRIMTLAMTLAHAE
ncbi:hypothetical protein Shyhy01_21900 [Streptomyces hygroscopicus subsp. hygroscopicus]|nr:hypothetical protein Shyhy01_21900 [Streptomyces hygroscopicus subsp. hygroscopicus]